MEDHLIDQRLAVYLHDHLEALWTEREKRLDERWIAQERSLVLATAELSKKLELLNELRGNVLARGEYEAKHEQLISEVKSLRDAFGDLGAKVAAGPPDLTTIRQAVFEATGERIGHSSTVQIVLSIVGVISGYGLLLVSIATHGFH